VAGPIPARNEAGPAMHLRHNRQNVKIFGLFPLHPVASAMKIPTQAANSLCK
jgi:hypothetical protein